MDDFVLGLDIHTGERLWMFETDASCTTEANQPYKIGQNVYFTAKLASRRFETCWLDLKKLQLMPVKKYNGFVTQNETGIFIVPFNAFQYGYSKSQALLESSHPKIFPLLYYGFTQPNPKWNTINIEKPIFPDNLKNFLLDENVLYQRNYSSVKAVDLLSQKTLWNFKTHLAFPHSQDIIMSHHVLFIADDNLKAIDSKTGQLLWQYHFSTLENFIPFLGTHPLGIALDDDKRFLYTVDNNATLYKIKIPTFLLAK